MSEASLHDKKILLMNDVVENAGAAAGYLEGLILYNGLKNPSFMKANLRCAVACIRAAARSWNEMEALDKPALGISEAAE